MAQEALDRAGITLNKNPIPNDPRSPFVTSGLRIGTPAMTTAGMKEPEMAAIAALIGRALRGRDDDAELAAVRDDVNHPLLQVHALPRALIGCRRVRLLAVLVLAASPPPATWLLTFVVRNVAGLAFGVVVKPDERRVHDEPTPTAGGAAMFLAFLVAMGVASQMHRFRPVFARITEPLGGAGRRAIIFAVGHARRPPEVSARPRLRRPGAGRSSALYLLGVTMFFFRVPFAGFVVLSPDLAPLVTVLWVVGMANAVNLIDGLDGLAAGIVAIAAGRLLPLRRPPLQGPACSGPTTSVRSSPSSPAGSASASCPTTSTRPRSSWATPAPCSSAC